MKTGLTLALLLALAVSASSAASVVMCYFSTTSAHREGNGYFDVKDIDPALCTHLMYAFAGLDKEDYVVKSLDPEYDLGEDGGYARFNALKTQNADLLTFLTIGGWEEGSTAYSEMAQTPERRAAFIASVVDLLVQYNFNGLDFDWEYPGGRPDSPGFPEDKENFGMLLSEMRAEFDLHGLKMTAVVSPAKDTIDRAYDIEAMERTLDFVSVLTYDYHGWWPGHEFTGHYSPLFALPEEEADPEHPGHTFNTDFSIQYWLSLGVSSQKLLLGMGAYGRGFVLADAAEHGLYAPAVDAIAPGKYTGMEGVWGYGEYCEVMHFDGELEEWTLVRDENVVAPYIYKGDQWLGFDDVHSIRAKSQYILDHNLGGGFVWAIDTDDFHDFCGEGKFPIISNIKDVLNGGA